jgi:hypothetical protein
MKTVWLFGVFQTIYPTTQRNIPEDLNTYSHLALGNVCSWTVVNAVMNSQFQ